MQERRAIVTSVKSIPDDSLGGPRLAADTERDFPLLSSPCIPAGLNIKAYSLNFTVIPNPSGPLRYLTVWATGTSQPTLNNPTGTVVANAAIVAPGTNGEVAVYPYGNTTDLLIDINGYFAAAGTGGLSLYPAAQCRVIDTRQNGGAFENEKTILVAGSVCAPSTMAQTYVFNATVLPNTGFSYLTLWADGQLQPNTSTLDAYDGFATSNMAIVANGPNGDGSTDAYAYGGTTQLLLDILGYFAP